MNYHAIQNQDFHVEYTGGIESTWVFLNNSNTWVYLFAYKINWKIALFSYVTLSGATLKNIIQLYMYINMTQTIKHCLTKSYLSSFTHE